MANSLISNNVNRADRNLAKIESKGPGQIVITQQKNPHAEASWIAATVEKIIQKGAHQAK
jgi:superfamily I DNA/RNA helicase